MKLRDIIKHLRNKPVDAWWYILGHFRLFLYKNKYTRKLIREHVLDTYERRKVLAKKCYESGVCFCCGCESAALLMADKPCSVGNTLSCKLKGMVSCYDKMPSRKEWLKQKEHVK